MFEKMRDLHAGNVTLSPLKLTRCALFGSVVAMMQRDPEAEQCRVCVYKLENITLTLLMHHHYMGVSP